MRTCASWSRQAAFVAALVLLQSGSLRAEEGGAAPGAASRVEAGEPASRAPRRDAAACQRLYEEGLELYSEGRYAEAASAFQAAYEWKPLPRLLINIGQAQ